MNARIQLDRETLAAFCRKWRLGELSQTFGRPVDLVEKEALRNPWRRNEILRTREVLYAA
jgi:predicted nucleotidyltransferase